MGFPNLVPVPADGDWAAVRRAIAVLASLKLGPGATPHFAGLDVDTLTVDSVTITGLSGVLQATAGVISGGAAHSALASIGANDHHNQAHVLDGADHTVSGLTAGRVLTALSATTFGWQEVYTTGFVNRTGSTLSLSTRTLTVGVVSGSFDIYSNGAKITKTGGATCETTIPATVGIHYLYFDTAGTLQNSMSVWDFTGTSIPVASIYWNGSAGTVSDERHSAKRNQMFHEWAHDTVGCRYETGFAQTSPTTSVDGKIELTAGTIHDEDIAITTTVAQGKLIRNFYETAAGVWTWANGTDNAGNDYPYIRNAGTGKVQHPDTDSAYALNDCADARYIPIWIYATTDKDRPFYSLTPALSQGYTTIGQARDTTPPSTAGLLTPEMKLIYRWIFNGAGEYQEGQDYRASSSLPAGGTIAINAASVLFSPSGSIVATNVQTALEELDAHLGIQLLTDPGADRIMFWDNSEAAMKWLTVSTGLDITATTLTCTITQYTDALARAALSSTATGLTYTSATGVFSFTAGYEIPTTVALAAKITNPMTTAGDIILGGASGVAGRLAIGANDYVLTSNGTTAAWEAVAAAGSDLDTFGVFLSLLEAYRISENGITKVVDGIVINGHSAGWADSALSSNTSNDATNGFRYPTGGGSILVYQEWGDYQATAVGDSADVEYMQAQSFTLAGSSAVAGVSLGIEALTGGITDALMVSIQTDSAGSPSGTAAGLTNVYSVAGVATGDALGDIGGVEQRLAQGFTPAANVYIANMAINFVASSGSPSGQVTLRIETNNAGAPSGTLVDANATKAITPTASAVNTFTFPALIPLTSGTLYWFVLSCGVQSTNVYWGIDESSTSEYAGGGRAVSADGGVTWGAASATIDITGSIKDATLTKAQAGVAGVWNNFTFVTGATLAAGTYWIVASVPAQTTETHYRWNLTRSNPYSGGARKQSINAGVAWTQPSANDDFQFKVWAADTVAVDATLVSHGVPLSVVPTQCKFLVLYSETNDAITLNTDLKLYASRDDGTTFTELTATLYAGDPRWKIAYGTIDVSGQPSGQTGRWKVATANSKNVFLHGYAAQWS